MNCIGESVSRHVAKASRKAADLASIGLFMLAAAGATSLCAADKYLWTELIAFDNTLPDFGVGEYLSRMEVKPKGVSFLFVEPEIVHGYKNLDSDYPIEDGWCSYCARPFNEERRRQRWTAYQLRDLVATLSRRGVESYASFFEVTAKPNSGYFKRFGAKRPETAWFDSHREVGYVLRNGRQTYETCVIKRFSDGTYYEDFFTNQLVRFVRDYGFVGYHACDGYGHPRHPLSAADFSEDVLSQFAERNPEIRIPSGTCEERAVWILANVRAKWCRFYAARHAEFISKVVRALKAEGKKTFVNTSWTRDPHEALYRYGEDYRLLARTGIDGFMSEASATVLELEGWNHDKVSTLDRCRATALRIASCVDVPLVHLACIKDGMEEYNSLRHSPTRTEAEVIGLQALFRSGRRAEPDVLWCLADGITADEWRKLDKTWRTLPAAAKPEGVRVVWSDHAADAELDSYCEERQPSSFRLLELLMHYGAVVSCAVNVNEAIADDSLPLLILNPAYYGRDELAALRNRKAPVVEFGLGAAGCAFGAEPKAEDPTSWLHPLPARELPKAAYLQCVAAINAMSPVRPDSMGMEDLRVTSYLAEDGSRIVVGLNDKPTYLNSRIVVDGPVKFAEALTENPSLPVIVDGLPDGRTRLKVKIPPSGVVVLRLFSM